MSDRDDWDRDVPEDDDFDLPDDEEEEGREESREDFLDDENEPAEQAGEEAGLTEQAEREDRLTEPAGGRDEPAGRDGGGDGPEEQPDDRHAAPVGEDMDETASGWDAADSWGEDPDFPEERTRSENTDTQPYDLIIENMQNRRAENSRADAAPAKQKNAREKFRFAWIIPVALGCVFAFSLYKFLNQYLTYQQAINEYKDVGNMITEIPDPAGGEDASDDAAAEETAAEESTEKEDDGIPDVKEPAYPKMSIDFDGLAAANSEFAGVIRIPVLDLTYPFAQTDNNEKYLSTTFEGTNNASGCIFLDCTASKDFSDWNTYIFGHNMKNQTMFGSLKRFISDDTLCDSDPYIYIYVRNHAGDTVKEQILGKTCERTLTADETRILVYRIFAYYTIPVDDDVYEDFEGDDGYDAYVADAQNHSLYTPEEGTVDWTLRPDLLTLSTCYATGHVNNFIVQGALVGIAHEK